MLRRVVLGFAVLGRGALGVIVIMVLAFDLGAGLCDCATGRGRELEKRLRGGKQLFRL